METLADNFPDLKVLYINFSEFQNANSSSNFLVNTVTSTSFDKINLLIAISVGQTDIKIFHIECEKKSVVLSAHHRNLKQIIIRSKVHNKSSVLVTLSDIHRIEIWYIEIGGYNLKILIRRTLGSDLDRVNLSGARFVNPKTENNKLIEILNRRSEKNE